MRLPLQARLARIRSSSNPVRALRTVIASEVAAWPRPQPPPPPIIRTRTPRGPVQQVHHDLVLKPPAA